ncbi:MAG TPA: S-adenosylmethionine:tRNA ribosyltransferase-isomerase [Bacteroidia bacterium]|nr:S-adenosylmethionine:tRNA ribosyltransferase-isomerase [Bacteroidia bacterium]
MSSDPRHLSISSFTYDLPPEKIAQHPLPERDTSKLLVYRDGKISDSVFRAVANHIPPGSLLIFNTTRVVRARLQMHRATGGAVEIFCTDAADPSKDFVRVLAQTGEAEVTAFVGNARRWKDDEELVLELESFTLRAKKTAAVNDQFKIHLSWNAPALTFAEVLETIGKIPLPPYMHREEEPEDDERYQTIFAEANGSVAAPTAGLHFTPTVLESLKEKNITPANVTLHVGAGTFKPVQASEMGGHDMHREQVIVSKKIIEQLQAFHQAGVTAVGTTSLRTLESLYWFGRQLILQPGQFRNSLFVGQWEPYESGPEVPAPVALQAIADWMREYNHSEIRGYTQILIAPGYRFRIVNALITNFHQPQSTLLLLVAAFAGEDFRRIYDHALQNDYRFLSYGDSSLLFRND